MSSAPSTARWGRRSFQGGKDARQLENFLLPILGCLVTIERLLRRADREAEGARLLSEYAPKGHLGFESPALRQYEFEEGSHLGLFFCTEKGGWGFEPERARALSKRESVCSPWAKSRQALKPEGMRSMPGHPQLSASLTLKKGPIGGPFLLSRKGAGDSNPQKMRRPVGRLLSASVLFFDLTSRAPWLRSRSLP